jgi:hypothetical protein
MGRKKKPKPDDPEQYAHFLEIAKAVQEEGAEERFEKMCEKILKPAKRKA